MKLKQATAADIPLIQDLARRSWENAYADILSKEQMEFMLSEMYSETEILNHFQNPHYHYYLIQDEGNDSYEGFIGYEHHYEEKPPSCIGFIWFRRAKEKGSEKKPFSFSMRRFMKAETIELF